MAGIKRILLDPGHEWEEPGSTQADGQSEVSYTVPVAQLARSILLAGWECEVFLTHEGAGVIPGGNLAAELEARSRMADELAVDFFLAVHHNAGVSAAEGAEYYIHTKLRKYNGQVTRFYPPGYGDLVWLNAEAMGEDGTPNHDAPRSLAAARVIVPIVAEALAAQGIRWRGGPNRIMAMDAAVLRYCSVPCGLIETHFGSNAREDELADRPEFRQAVASAIAHGIAAYLELPVRARGPYPDVPADHWAAERIARAKALGLMSGHPDGSFGLGQGLLREEAAALAVNLYDRIMDDVQKNR